MPVAQRDHLALPEGAVGGPAVDEEHRRATARPVVAERDAGMGQEGHVGLVARVPSGPQGAQGARMTRCIGQAAASRISAGVGSLLRPVSDFSYRLDGTT